MGQIPVSTGDAGCAVHLVATGRILTGRVVADRESVSECPWLNGAYAYNFVRGMQGGDPRHVKIAATCKHWYAYSLEDSDGKTRHDFDANVSARDLAETYLVPFQPCVAASVEQIMCSYNAVNGVPTW